MRAAAGSNLSLARPARTCKLLRPSPPSDEDYGNFFYTGLGEESVRLAEAEGYDVLLSQSITRTDGTDFDVEQLDSALAEVLAARPDVLLLVLRKPEWVRSLDTLEAARPPVDGGHSFMLLWYQGASWGGNCVGTAERCAHVLGATQIGFTEAMDAYEDRLLGGKTYRWLLEESGYVDAGIESDTMFPDAAMIPSMFAQALQQVFRFRPLTDTERPLSDTTDYGLLLDYMASGETIAKTFYGSVSFDVVGQNAGRKPTTLQVAAHGDASGTSRIVFPPAVAEMAFTFPAPSMECPADAWRIEYGSACLLCAPEQCQIHANLTECERGSVFDVSAGGVQVCTVWCAIRIRTLSVFVTGQLFSCPRPVAVLRARTSWSISSARGHQRAFIRQFRAQPLKIWFPAQIPRGHSS